MTRRIWVPNPSHATINCWIADYSTTLCKWTVRLYNKGGDSAGQLSRLEVAELEQMVKDNLATELDPEPEPESTIRSYFDPAYKLLPKGENNG